MGRGDRRTKRGKISSSSYGNARPKTKKESFPKKQA
jgi:ribosomal small subunit protein bTHX